MRIAVRLVFPAVVAVAAAGCGPGTAAEVVRAEAPTAHEAMKEEAPPACNSVPANAEPLIVDLSTTQRLDLEVAMKSGLPVVRYGCDGLAILKGCQLTGDYGFAGVSLKEDVIQLTSKDEVRANLPISGVNLAGEMDRGTSMDLGLAMVGKLTTALSEAAKGDLKGSCDGATHFVRAAFVGAFAMRRGSGARVKAAADIFLGSASASSQSDKVSFIKDGDHAECRKSSPDQATPPGQCRSAIRIELVAFGAKSASAEGLGALTDPCPDGYALSAGKCAPKASAEAFLCSPDDEKVCREQCDKGSIGSCYNLAHLLTEVADACKGKGESCLAYSVVPEGHAKYARYQEGARLYEKACDGGQAAACFYVGTYHDEGAFGKAKDPAKAEQSLERACAQGHALTCRLLGDRYHKVDKNDPRALKFARRACDLGDKPGCFSAISKLLKGEGTPKDPAAAQAILKRTCDAGDAKRCGELGLFHLEGWGGTKDPATGLQYVVRSCDMNRLDGCRMAAMLYTGQSGVQKDPAKARQFFERGCAGEEAKTTPCTHLAKKLPK